MSVHVSNHVETLSQREPVFSAPDDTLRSLAHKMWSESVGVVVIGDQSRARGVVSERDIVAELAQGADPDATTAGEIMTPHIVSARPGDLVYEAAGKMLDEGIRHLPIIEASGRVTGVVSVRDLLRPLLLDALSVPDPRTDPGAW